MPGTPPIDYPDNPLSRQEGGQISTPIDMLDDEDRPIASFLVPGNTADVTMLVPVVTRLKE